METWKDNEIMNESLTDNGVYDILCACGGEEDKP
jgi:hypothetical protein